MFIAFDGGEGVGKTTQIKLLRDRLPALFPDREFIFTREPGGSPLAERIRDVILNREAQGSDGKAMFGLFAAARADHLARTVLPNLKLGKVVITDRFVAATYAYQVCAMHNPVSEELFEAYFRNLDARPSYTAIFDIDPEISQVRVKARNGQDSNHFDERELQFHKDLRRGYDVFATKFTAPGHRVELFNADRSPEDLHEDLIVRFKSLLS